ncbi:MAG TPA: FecR domain-containing protein [Steroidobacteraceae bacterium]|nr:FecR domain-containing protein [Steroidobacteraceae bacterium]
MSPERGISLNDQISQEAAEWLVELRTGDADPVTRRDFDAWLRASPEHIRAFIEMAALWHEGGAVDSRHELDVEAIIARAESEPEVLELTPAAGAGAGADASMPLGPTLAQGVAPSAAGTPRSSRVRVAGWAAAAGFLLAGLATALFLRSAAPVPQLYATGVGARRLIVLPDGSKVLLDSKSRLRVSYTAATRNVELLQGQALFEVVENPQRPFLVYTGNALVRDVGTVFDVNRIGGGTIVTVVEGRVAVATPSQPLYLSAGEQLDVHLGQLSLRPINVDISSTTAWTDGQVVLQSATLSDVAQVFNRYSARRLVARDLGRKPLRLSGVFSTDPNFLMRYLRSRPDIAVTENGSEIDIVRKPIGARS